MKLVGLEVIGLVIFGAFLEISCQIQGLFSQLLTSKQDVGKNCASMSVSCLPSPWCQRTKDENGCYKCTCGVNTNHGGKRVLSDLSSRQGAAMNPFASMFGAGGSFGFPAYPSFNGQMGPMNPMAAIFGSSAFGGGGAGGRPFSNPMGGMGGMGGFGWMGGMGGFGGMGGMMGGQNTATASPDCDPSPYTCPAPPPWCQRTVDEKGCVKCYCGEDLQKYLSKLQGKSPETTPETNSTDENITATTTIKNDVTTFPLPSTSTSTPAPPLGKPCLANFMCTLDCVTGFQTDQNNCPVCACNGNNNGQSHGSVLPSHTVQQKPTVTSTTANVIMCPGIFDCMKQCMNGYVVDSQGCPLCKCVPDS